MASEHSKRLQPSSRIAASADMYNSTARNNQSQNLIKARNCFQSMDTYFTNGSTRTVQHPQDDVYQILQDSGSIPGTKSLSPYIPLPAIGRRLPTPIPSNSSTPHLVRENTYHVLRPRFVRGPSHDGDTPPSSQNIDQHQRKKKKPRKKAKMKSLNVLMEQSSATKLFGPQLNTHSILLQTTEEVEDACSTVVSEKLRSRNKTVDEHSEEITMSWFD